MKRISGPRAGSIGRIVASAATIFFVGATVGRTSAAFTATVPIEGSIESGIVELDTGGVQRLTFGDADLTAIGPGTTFSESITVSNMSTVTTPSAITDIALWSDTSSAPADPGELSAVLQVNITRSIGGGATTTIYSGRVSDLSSFGGFATPIGGIWSSENGGSATGSTATQATYTFSFSLPKESSTGAGSIAGISFVFEARNRTT